MVSGKGTAMSASGLSLLERRKIEAAIAASLINGFAEESGREKATQTACRVIEQLAKEAGRQMGEGRGTNRMADLARIWREVWSHGGALEIRFLSETEDQLFFDVTRCRYAEEYEKLGVREFGFCLSCIRDSAFAAGFNPRIRLKRTQTIMEGASSCDFRYTLE